MNLEQLCQPAPGGIGTYTARLATLLPALLGDSGELVGFCARHPRSTVSSALDEHGVGIHAEVLALPRPLLYDVWATARICGPQALSRRLRDVDVVHAPSLAVPPTRASTALVVTVHDAAHERFPQMYPRRGLRFHRRGMRAARDHADAVICPTAAAADDVSRLGGISRDRIHVVHHGVDRVDVTPADVDSVRHRFGIGAGTYVLWVGTLEPRKNLPLLLDAFEHLGGDARLVLVGPSGWLDTAGEVARRARSLGDRVVTTGRVSRGELHALYAGAAVFAFPSTHEGFGLPVIEAMSHGTPVVCSDDAAVREVAGSAALVVGSTDSGAWTAALGSVLDDAAEARRLAEAGRTRAGEFDWSRCAAATLAVYRAVAR
ncbi:MAG: glycosyltransferase family 4 protein [Acidimicrobiia bacterium]|nr:glycosyltransferase family 4 protein [Acidimicrobiia bacterium]